MCHRHQIMLTSSLYGPFGRGLPIGHSIHFNYHQKYHGSEETTHVPQHRHNVAQRKSYAEVHVFEHHQIYSQIFSS